jgi:hypothetical protein
VNLEDQFGVISEDGFAATNVKDQFVSKFGRVKVIKSPNQK